MKTPCRITILLLYGRISLLRAQVNFGTGASTGTRNLQPGIEVQVAQQGTKLSDMDTNLNRRLDDLSTSIKEVKGDVRDVQKDVSKISVVSSMVTFGGSHVFTVIVTVLLTFFSPNN